MTAELRKVKEAVARRHAGGSDRELECVGVFDISGSMDARGPDSPCYSKIAELNKAVSILPQEILKDEHAASLVRLAAIIAKWCLMRWRLALEMRFFRPIVR